MRFRKRKVKGEERCWPKRRQLVEEIILASAMSPTADSNNDNYDSDKDCCGSCRHEYYE